MKEHPASSITSLIKVRPARSTWVSCSLALLLLISTHLFPEHHYNLSLAFQIAALDFLNGVVRLAFSERCRVDAIVSIPLFVRRGSSLGCEVAEGS